MNKEVIIDKLRKKELSISELPINLYNDKEFVLVVLRELKLDFSDYLGEILKKDKDVMLEIVKIRGLAIVLGDDNIKNDKKIVLEAVKNNWESLKYASNSLKNDIDIARMYIKGNNYNNLKYIGDELKNDKEFIIYFIKLNGLLLKDVSKDLKNDIDVVKYALLNNIESLKYMGVNIRKNSEAMIELIKIDDRVLKYIDESLLKDEVFMLRATNNYQVSLF